MKGIKSLWQGWFGGRTPGMRDLYALGVLTIAPLGFAAAQAGFWGACLGMGGILAVLLLATFADGGWFKKPSRPASPPADHVPAVALTAGKPGIGEQGPVPASLPDPVRRETDPFPQ